MASLRLIGAGEALIFKLLTPSLQLVAIVIDLLNYTLFPAVQIV